MASTDWPAIIADINQKYGTTFAPNETGPALQFLVDQFNGCASQAGTAAGVSQNVTYKACRRYGVKITGKHGPKVNWPKCLSRINEILSTAYTMEDFTAALRAIIDKEGGYRHAAKAIGCGETAIRRRAQQFGIYSPYYNGKRQSDEIRPVAVATVDADEWRRSGMHRSPCAICRIGRGTKARPECDACGLRHEYAMIGADLPSRRCVDLFNEKAART
jgi:hypothetical protein